MSKRHLGACKPRSERGGTTPPEVESTGTETDSEQHGGVVLQELPRNHIDLNSKESRRTRTKVTPMDDLKRNVFVKTKKKQPNNK
jgi:hypothetical protein